MKARGYNRGESGRANTRLVTFIYLRFNAPASAASSSPLIAASLGKKTGTELFTANAKDLALVFAVLPTLPITSPNVLLAGNANVMRIKYSTELADYETYIPAADIAGVRDATAFEMYGA